MVETKYKLKKLHQKNKNIKIVLFILLFALVGTYFIARSHALSAPEAAVNIIEDKVFGAKSPRERSEETTGADTDPTKNR
jgi:hypothetical protein